LKADDLTHLQASAILSGSAPLPVLRDGESLDDSSLRAMLLTGLLNWCRTSGMLGLPRPSWFPEEEEEERAGQAEEHQEVVEDGGKKRMPLASASRKIWCKTFIDEQKRATAKVGFLILPYRPSCWYWELFEMGRKIVLTVILSFIRTGSASQVVAGLVLSFVVLLINIYVNPFVTPSLNQVRCAALHR